MEKFQPPSWAGSPEAGVHLDVIKDGKIVEKLPVDEKPYYLFGRNVDVVDIITEHASCSRVHAALIFHKTLKDRAFLMDLGSAHGTFIGHLRLEPHAAKPLQYRQVFHVGASTRTYALKSRADFEQPVSSRTTGVAGSDSNNKFSVIPPEASEEEIQAMTSYNTTQNTQLVKPRDNDNEQWSARKQQQQLGQPLQRKRPLLLSSPSLIGADSHVNFKEQDEIINPEDIDPSIGKFRDMVRVQVISGPLQTGANAAKRRRLMQDLGLGSASVAAVARPVARNTPFYMPSKVIDNSGGGMNDGRFGHSGLYGNLSSTLPTPNLAPDVAFNAPSTSAALNTPANSCGSTGLEESSALDHQKLFASPGRQRHGVFFAGEPPLAEPMDSSPYRVPVRKNSDDMDTHIEPVASASAHAGQRKYVKEVWPGKAPDPMPREEHEGTAIM